MKKGVPPILEWITLTYLAQVKMSGGMMGKIRREPKVSHFHAKRQSAQILGQIAKSNRRSQIPDEPEQD